MGLFADKFTQDKSQFEVRDLWIGCWNSEDLIYSDKTGLKWILLPDLN